MTRNAQCHTDAHRACQHLAVDGHPFAQRRLQAIGQRLRGIGIHRRRRYDDELVATESGDQVRATGTFAQAFGEDADEPVAGGVAEIVVDRLQPVEVEEQRRYGPRLAGGESRVEVCQQRAAIVQAGEVVVFGKVAQLVFGAHPRLQLGEQRSDRLERVEFFGSPVAVAELDEAEHPGRDVAGQQRHARHRCRRDLPTLVDRALVVVGGRFRTENDGFLLMLSERENRISVGEVDDGERVRVRDPGTDRPLGNQYRGANAVIVAAQEADVDIEVLDEVGQHPLTHLDRGGRVHPHQLGGD